MDAILCYSFGALSFLFLCRALIDPREIYRFPFLISFASLVFIFPSAYSALESLNLFPQINYTLAIGNALACLVSGLVGYYWSPRRPSRRIGAVLYDVEKVFVVNLAVLFLGLSASIYLMRMGDIDDWRGLPVYVANVARFLRPGILIAVTAALLRPALWKWAVICGSMVFPLINMYVYLRRSEVFFYAVIIGFPFYFIRKKTPPRAAIPLALVGGFLLITLVPVYRDYSTSSKRTDKKIDAAHEIKGFLSGERSNEFLDSAESMELVRRWGNYDYGIWFYNNLVMLYIPRGIFGAEFKQSLLIDLGGISIIALREQYGTTAFKSYLAPTGYAQAFFEFGYFGGLFFFFFAKLCRHLETKAALGRDIRHVLIYCFFAIFIPFSVSTSITEIPGLMLPSLVIILAVTSACRVGQRRIISGKPISPELRNALPVSGRAGE